MKKLISLFSFILLFTALSAQQVPNGSFQYWSSSWTPDGWGTWASAIGPLNFEVGDSIARLAVKDTTLSDYITDSATLRLTVDTITLPSQGLVTLAGFASLGGANYYPPPLNVGLSFGYIQYTERPDTLYFDFKFVPAAGFHDTAYADLSLTRFDTIDHIRLQILNFPILITTATNGWQRNYAFPIIDYYSAGLPDTLRPDSMQLIFYSSISIPPSRGTTLWIDSVHFDASVNPVVSGITDVASLHGVNVYPNPSDGKLQIGVEQKEIGSGVKLYNASGQQVYEGKLEGQLSAIDTRSFPPGTYTLRILSMDRMTVYRGAVSIVH